MIYCAKCGTSNPEQSRFCRNCGSTLQMQTVRPSVAASTVVIVFVLLLLAASMMVAFSKGIETDVVGIVLMLPYLLVSVAVIPMLSFVKEQGDIKMRNFHFVTLLVLLIANILMILLVLNGSMLLPHVLLSAGLAVNTIVAWFRCPAESEDN